VLNLQHEEIKHSDDKFLVKIELNSYFETALFKPGAKNGYIGLSIYYIAQLEY